VKKTESKTELYRLRSTLMHLLSALLVLPAAVSGETRETAGWVEKVAIKPPGMLIHAKLDTGADYSSLSASDIEEFKKDGKDWVRFWIDNRYGEKKQIEAEVRRIALIKRHAAKPHKRVVVRLGLCVGRHFMEADVNLVDRRNFDFQMLVGRNFLAGNLLVDPANTYTLEPGCKEIAGEAD
jgi:hypothetical protein